MKFKAKINGMHKGEPMAVDVEVEFESGEYLEVLKTIPTIIGQAKSILNEEKAIKKAKKAMHENAKNLNAKRKQNA